VSVCVCVCVRLELGSAVIDENSSRQNGKATERCRRRTSHAMTFTNKVIIVCVRVDMCFWHVEGGDFAVVFLKSSQNI